MYFCRCGGNISGSIDPETIGETLPQDIVFKTVDFLCSEGGKEFYLQTDICRNRGTAYMMTKEPIEDPKIVAFLCNWCSYAGADNGGVSQQRYPANVDIIRVMCSGRVEAEFVMKAFEKGAEGVIILACHPGDCHYKEGNLRAAIRHQMLEGPLEQFGIDKRRLRFDYVSASEGERFVKIVSEMTSELRNLKGF